MSPRQNKSIYLCNPTIPYYRMNRPALPLLLRGTNTRVRAFASSRRGDTIILVPIFVVEGKVMHYILNHVNIILTSLNNPSICPTNLYKHFAEEE
jgi:hypothetical protein